MLKKYRLIIFFLFLTVVMLFTLRGIPGNLLPDGIGENKIVTNTPPFETSMERGRYAQIISIATTGTTYVDKYADFLRPDLAWYNGHYLSAFPPGVAIIATPLYMAGYAFGMSQVVTYLIGIIFSLLVSFVLYLFAKDLKFAPATKVLVIFSFALASVAWAYSVTLSAHTASALIILTALFAFHKFGGSKSFWFSSLAFASAGAAFFVDYPNLLILFPIFIALLIKSVVRRKIIPFVSGSVFLVGFLVLFTIYNLNVYAQPFALTNRYNLKPLQNAGIDVDNMKLSNDIFKLKKYSDRFTFPGMIKGISVLTNSSDRGIFYYSPIFLLSLIGFGWAILKRQWWALVAVIAFTVDVLFYASFDDPWGGWGFGPRYIIPTIPLLALGMGYGFEKFVRNNVIAKVVFSILFVISISVALVGALTTTAIPPSVEAVGLGMPSNFILNFQILLNGGISSFIYNYTPFYVLPPFTYYLLLFIPVSLVALLAIWSPKKQ